MTIKELKQLLNQYDDDQQVVVIHNMATIHEPLVGTMPTLGNRQIVVIQPGLLDTTT